MRTQWLRSKHVFSVISLSLLVLAGPIYPAGVTLITHGLNGNIDDWVLGMAGRMANDSRMPGRTSTCYELYFTPESGRHFTLTWRRLAGVAPTNSDSGEVFIKLDWRQLANNDHSTFEVAGAVAAKLMQASFIPEMGGHALAELPLHLIGHSRGGSLVCELSRRLGTNGIWVDHLTTLDPHPLNNDGFDDFLYTVVDAPARTYENVLFHDNYYQNLDPVFIGEAVAGAYIRELTDLDGGYEGLAGAHSDVHLWYHGTIDLRTPTTDSVADITRDERGSWWTSYEDSGARGGWFYSRVLGGDRLSLDRPAGPNAPRVRTGYNQRWDLGAGEADNRVTLNSNNGAWPNVIRLNFLGTNIMRQGSSNAIDLYVQWAKSSASSASLAIYLDDDFNPFNGGNEIVYSGSIAGTTRENIGHGAVPLDLGATNTSTGVHTVFARISAAGKTRYLYAPGLITVLPEVDPPPVAPTIIAQPASTSVVLGGQVMFSVIATGSPPLFFQWRKEEADLSNATGSTLPLANVTSNDLGRYSVVITNAAGSVTSVVAELSITYPPIFLAQPTNRIVLVGEPLTVMPELDGTAPFIYRWFFNGRLLRTQTDAQLSIPSATSRNKGKYQVEVRNVAGTVRSDSFTVTVVTPPGIVSAPRSLTVKTGRRAAFRVVAKGSPPLAYQWFKDDIQIDGATKRVLTLPSVQDSDAGIYTVRISNPGAIITSPPATLTVTP